MIFLINFRFIFKKQDNSFLHDSHANSFILMNILFDEKRYDDILKVYYKNADLFPKRLHIKQFFVAAEANLEKVIYKNFSILNFKPNYLQ